MESQPSGHVQEDLICKMDCWQKKVHCPKYIAGRIYLAEIYCGQEPWKSHLSSLMGLFSLVICQWKWIKISCIFYWGVGTKTIKSILVRQVWGKGAWSSLNPMQYIQIPACLSYECFQLNGPTLCCFASVITWSTVFSVFSVFSQHIQLRFLLSIQFWKCISLISKRYFCSSYSKPFKVLYKLFSN